MFRIFVIGLLLPLAGCITAAPGPAQEGDRLMRELRLVSGGDALNAFSGFHESGVISADGKAGAYETWGDFHVLRYATTRTRDARSASSGFDGAVSWQKGPDGVVHTDTSQEGLASARLSAYITIAAYFYPARFPARFESKGRRASEGTDYDVVTVTPVDGAPVDFWLDTETHQLQRLSGMDGGAPFVGVVESYRTIEGVSVPFVLRQAVGGHVVTLTLTSYEFTEVDPARLAIPDHE